MSPHQLLIKDLDCNIRPSNAKTQHRQQWLPSSIAYHGQHEGRVDRARHHLKEVQTTIIPRPRVEVRETKALATLAKEVSGAAAAG
jgi:hypothetical protein